MVRGRRSGIWKISRSRSGFPSEGAQGSFIAFVSSRESEHSADGSHFLSRFRATYSRLLRLVRDSIRTLRQPVRPGYGLFAQTQQAFPPSLPDFPFPSPPDLKTIQPAISAMATDRVVKITKGCDRNSDHLDRCELQVDRGDGHSFVPLDFDTTPNHDDTQLYPTAPCKWSHHPGGRPPCGPLEPGSQHQGGLTTR